MASASYNAGPYILGINWIVAGAAVLIVLLRLIAKRRVRNVAWDDAAMLFALVRTPFPMNISPADSVRCSAWRRLF